MSGPNFPEDDDYWAQAQAQAERDFAEDDDDDNGYPDLLTAEQLAEEEAKAARLEKELADVPVDPLFLELQAAFRVQRDAALAYATANEPAAVETLNDVSNLVDALQKPITWTNHPAMRADEKPPGRCDQVVGALSGGIKGLTGALGKYAAGGVTFDELNGMCFAASVGFMHYA